MQNSLTSKYRLFSFFSGAGFLDLGFEHNGYEIVFVNEIYKPFLESYKYSRNMLKLHEPIYGYHQEDVTELLGNSQKKKIRDLIISEHRKSHVVGFIGGPPCPDFSIGGKNQGRHGDKGKLSETYIELICQLRPDFFVFENVKGLWKTKKHREFYEEIKQKIQINGYITTERLINALEYGAPQDRDRIILIGFREDFLIDADESFNLTNKTIDYFPWEKFIVFPKENLHLYEWPKMTPFEVNSELPSCGKVYEKITVNHWFQKNEVDTHQNAEDYFKPKSIKKFLTINEGDDSRKSFKRLHRWRYSPTAAYGNNEVHLHPYKARRLSVAEALAIQSLPKNFVLPENMTLTSKFKTIGNGVPYLASKAIAKTISYYLERKGL